MTTGHAACEALPPADYTGKGPTLEVSEEEAAEQGYESVVKQPRAQTLAGFRLAAPRTGQ